MTIEEKAIAYDEALKVLHKYDGANIMFSQSLKEEMFPELAESEDEKIRKALIRYFTLSDEHAYNEACGVSYRDIVTWLEKQGEQKLPIEKLPSEMKTIGKSLGFTTQEDCDRYNQMVSDLIMSDDDKGGQNSADKAEPKFHERDWIVYEENTYQIHNISLKKYYECLRTDGTVHTFDFEHIDSKSHLWTIEDAKEGDILCDYSEAYDNPLIFILKKFEHVNFGLVRPSDYSSYCFLTAGDIQKFKEGTYHHEHNIKPATKEQRDLLFQKMKEAGYEWDAEKKESKKIEQKPVQDEEDEKRIKDIIYFLDTAKKHYASTVELDTCIDWLKSLKDKVQLQNTITDEELAQAKKDAYNDALDKIEYHNGEPTFDDGWSAAIWYLKKRNIQSQPKQEWSEEDERMMKSLTFLFDGISQNIKRDFRVISDVERDNYENWLKSLKDKVQSQPKQEWSEEDIRLLDNCISLIEDIDCIGSNYHDGLMTRKEYEHTRDWLNSLKDRII